jgi:ketosteroid isomerase-like protein
MSGLILSAVLLTQPITTEAKPMTENNLAQRIQLLEDKSALKALVDTFSNLADRKDVKAQLPLFTEDAIVDSYINGQLISSLNGREQIGQGFGGFLALFDAVYHHNGQQTVEIHGDKAKGVSYCLVVLIGKENGKTYKNTSGVIYNDEYVRRGQTWLIAKRVSNFAWQQREELPQAAQ